MLEGRQRLHYGGAVILDAVDECAHWRRYHQLRGEWFEQLCVARDQPALALCWSEHNRHPIVDGLHEFVWFCRDDCECPQLLFSVGAVPFVPESCHAECAFLVRQEIRLFCLPCFLPFIEAVGDDNAAVALDEVLVCRLLIECLGAGVDHREHHLGFFGP